MNQYLSLLRRYFYGLLCVVKEEGCPFIVCMTYAFHTNDKLCFILDLMNGKHSSAPHQTRPTCFCSMLAGGDLHYHLSQHGVFSEKEVKFYAAEIILGLEHMHLRSIVYRDLKVSYGGDDQNILSPLILSTII